MQFEGGVLISMQIVFTSIMYLTHSPGIELTCAKLIWCWQAKRHFFYLFFFMRRDISCGGRQGGLKLPPPVPFTPASRPLPKGFPRLYFIYIVKCYAILQNFSLFSRFPPPWESRFPPFPLPPPVPLVPPILAGSHPPVPLHYLRDKIYNKNTYKKK